MTAIVYLLAGLIVLVRVYVPISITVLGLWPLRFSLFFLWFLAVKNVGGPSWRNFVRTLRSRSTEMTYYGIWVAVLTCFWLLQQGEHLLTSYLLTAYIGAIPFYFVGTYFSVSENKGRRMALATAVVVGITCLIAIPNVWQDPTLVRMGAIDSTAETRSLGIGSYGDLTGFGIVLPFFISSAFQSRRFARMLGIVACGATVALLMISTFSGMILLAGMAVTGCILYYLFLGGIHLRRTLWTSAAVMVVGVATIALFPGVSERGQFAFDKLGTTSASLPDILRQLAGERNNVDAPHWWSFLLDRCAGHFRCCWLHPVYHVASVRCAPPLASMEKRPHECGVLGLPPQLRFVPLLRLLQRDDAINDDCIVCLRDCRRWAADASTPPTSGPDLPSGKHLRGIPEGLVVL